MMKEVSSDAIQSFDSSAEENHEEIKLHLLVIWQVLQPNLRQSEPNQWRWNTHQTLY